VERVRDVGLREVDELARLDGVVGPDAGEVTWLGGAEATAWFSRFVRMPQDPPRLSEPDRCGSDNPDGRLWNHEPRIASRPDP
jgi:hypothetical protein